MIFHPRSPILLDNQVEIVDEAPTTAGTIERYIAVNCESVLASLFVNSTSGDVDVTVFTLGSGTDISEPVIQFPTISSPTANILLRQPARIMGVVKVVVTHTDACEVSLILRGVRAGAASVTIEGASTFSASQKTITTSAEELIPSSLYVRKGILITNNSVNGSATLYLGGTMAEATSTEGTPIRPGGNLTVNLAAGASLYSVSDGTDIDVRISQTG
jgi:hypothetical protein